MASLEPEPEYLRPRDPEWAFMVTGYSECIDSFFAFGLFALAKRSGFFPGAGRHLRAGHPGRRPPHHLLRELGGLALAQHALVAPAAVLRQGHRRLGILIWERIQTARDVGKAQDNNFTVTGSQQIGVDVDVATLMDVCLAENDRRLSGYDARLLQPRIVPRLVRLARRTFLKPKRSA
jgi:hypothetical protein